MTTQIAILDDDHVIRMVRYALGGPGEITDQWVRDFYLPEDMEPEPVFALGNGLHEADGISLIPMAAKLDLRKGSEAAILIFRRGEIDSGLMDANPKLKLIQRMGSRSDPIDLAAAKARGIAVSCLPRPVLHLTAEHAILLMLALGKRLIEADDAVRKDAWDRDRVHPEHGVAYNWAGITDIGGLYDKTIGIIGLGEVGSLVAAMAKGFGARVIYSNRTRLPAAREQALGVSYVPLDRLLAESDFVSLHANNLPENKAMLGAAAFAQMKPTAFFVNTSRGRMVDEAALHAALTRRTIAGAGLDVHFEEPRPTPDPYATLSNVILSPHIAGGSRKGILHEVKGILDNCRAILSGGEITHRVV